MHLSALTCASILLVLALRRRVVAITHAVWLISCSLLLVLAVVAASRCASFCIICAKRETRAHLDQWLRMGCIICLLLNIWMQRVIRGVLAYPHLSCQNCHLSGAARARNQRMTSQQTLRHCLLSPHRCCLPPHSLQLLQPMDLQASENEQMCAAAFERCG